jgi:hypothetical protein
MNDATRVAAFFIILLWAGCGDDDEEKKNLSSQYEGLGIFDTCLQGGQSFDAKFSSDPCCKGLKRSKMVTERGDGDTGVLCDLDGAPPSTYICLNCGDGTCSLDENRCNCSDDCGSRNAQ